MPQPTLSDIHVDSALTDFSVAYFQDAGRFAAPNVFPIVNVPQRSGKYFVYDRAELLRSDTQKRAPNTESAVRTYKLSNDSYFCEQYSIAVDVSEQEIANADPALDPEMDAASVAVQDLRIAMDQAWTEAAFSTGIWATESTATWNTSTGDPVGDIQTGVKTVLSVMGKRPNTLVLGADSWYTGLWTSTAIMDRIPSNAPKIVTPEFVGNLFGFDRVFILDSVASTGMEGSTGLAPAFIHQDHALIAYVDPGAGLRQATAGKTFMWTGLVGGGGGIRTKRYEMPKLSATRIETDAAFDFKVVATDLGYLISNTVS
jgi:hypothetical protein